MNGIASSFVKIKDLRTRLMATLLLICVYRLGVFVPTPGVNVAALREKMNIGENGLMGIVNMFSGGSLENFSIFTLGIAPYVTVSIIMQLVTPMIPALQALKSDGASGQRVITRYTRQLTVVLALIQSFMIAKGLAASSGLVYSSGWTFILSTVITLTAGTAFIMWLGEQITERGIGNGTSIIICSGILARMPAMFGQAIALAQTGEVRALTILGGIAVAVAVIVGIVYFERAQRRIPIQYPKRVQGNLVTQAQVQYMPLKLNMAGVIPPIFGYAVFSLFGVLAQFSTSENAKAFFAMLTPGHWLYYLVFVGLIFVLCFYFTTIIYDPEEVSENLKNNGGFIPTVRPGTQTAEYFYGVLSRLALWGAVYISFVCVVPQIIFTGMGLQSFGYIFGGTAILIVVSTLMDTYNQVQSHMLAANYEEMMARTTKIANSGSALRQMRARTVRR